MTKITLLRLSLKTGTVFFYVGSLALGVFAYAQSFGLRGYATPTAVETARLLASSAAAIYEPKSHGADLSSQALLALLRRDQSIPADQFMADWVAKQKEAQK